MDSFHRRSIKTPAAKSVVEPKISKLVQVTQRVDTLLVEQGLAPSRTTAQRLIEAGRVSWSEGVVAKPSLLLLPETVLYVKPDETDRFVSRGALKLQGALVHSGVSVAGKVCLDVGQSTGGFTDCLLQAGAQNVVGVDVGHGQLHPTLLADGRVTAFEGINCRTLSVVDLGASFPENGFDLIVVDVSFISLTLILPCLPALSSKAGQMLLLVKPQFEVGPGKLGKGGIVKDPRLYVDVERKLRDAAMTLGLRVVSWFDSPIKGADGNREFFIWMSHD
jgi:23S rRNA (cytidine1920-2'-O)/16S rRNA (cytidine1409-2'-O)-methyltransferase